ncbi:hypothetical protein GQ472_03595 [archaeon]|nr:hypothetical protein [archaeon]
MSQESEDKLENKPDSNGSGSTRHKKCRPLGLFPRDMKGGDRISFSEIGCLNIDQIVEMLENKHGGLVESAVFDPGKHYGFIVNTADVSEMFKDGGLAVDFKTRFYDFYTSTFTSPHCGKQRYQLHQDYVFSCIVKIKDKALVASLDENRDNVSDILRIIDGIEYSTVLLIDDPIIASVDAYDLVFNSIKKYLDNIDTVPFFLKREPVALLSGKPKYSKASS